MYSPVARPSLLYKKTPTTSQKPRMRTSHGVFSAVTLDGRRLDKRDDREQREQHLEPYKGHRDAVEHEVGSRHVDCHRTTVARRRSGELETEERGGVGAWGRRAWVRGRALTLQAQEVGVACERG